VVMQPVLGKVKLFVILSDLNLNSSVTGACQQCIPVRLHRASNCVHCYLLSSSIVRVPTSPIKSRQAACYVPRFDSSKSHPSHCLSCLRCVLRARSVTSLLLRIARIAQRG